LTNKLQKIISYSSTIATVLAFSPLSVLAVADPNIDLTKINDKWTPLAGITVQNVLVFVINGLLVVAGVVAFLWLLVGGLQWILAGGDKEGTEKARKKITNALIGLAIVFSAYALAFLVESIFGVSILNFTIPKIVP
jgi:hypothetical protein